MHGDEFSPARETIFSEIARIMDTTGVISCKSWTCVFNWSADNTLIIRTMCTARNSRKFISVGYKVYIYRNNFISQGILFFISQKWTLCPTWIKSLIGFIKCLVKYKWTKNLVEISIQVKRNSVQFNRISPVNLDSFKLYLTKDFVNWNRILVISIGFLICVRILPYPWLIQSNFFPVY